MGYIPVPPPPIGRCATYKGRQIINHSYDPETGEHIFDMKDGEREKMSEKQWFESIGPMSINPFHPYIVSCSTSIDDWEQTQESKTIRRVFQDLPRCAYCGTKALPEDRNCVSCGAPL